MTLIKRAGAIPAQTYRVAVPLATHWRPATCEEVHCPHFLNGWTTVLPAGSDHVAVLKKSGRIYTSERTQDGGLLEFVFPAGQPCFRASIHRIQTGRPGIFLHGPRERPRDQRAVDTDEWHERFVETMSGLAGK
ncbi:MAG: hypothetical protein Q8Q14_03650 [Gemmatimonadales bacterium]|nr:hypothetical protein [Gemmatimonadales bacterium]